MKPNCLALIAGITLAVSNSVFADYVWDDLQKGDLLWSESISLWSSAGTTDRIHDSRFNAGNLLLAARYGLAGDPRVEQVLQTLHSIQDSYGSIKTRYEDSGISDGNVSFFVCTPLLLLRHVYESELSANSLSLLDDIFLTFYHRFYDQSLKLDLLVHYPNPFLGDLTCAKLIQEHFSMSGDEAQTLELKMLEAAEYWRTNEWGWGEHMSDVYGMVCVDLISEYLLLTTNQQNQVYSEYVDLMAELLFIEDSYGGNPRVPAIRSYAFTGRTSQTNYRDEIQPWDDATMGSVANHFWRNSDLTFALFNELGWHEQIEPARIPTATDITVSCYDGTVATAVIKDDIRLGSMSRYPLMPDMEHITWGLLWQSFPVAFWTPDEDWAFLQWQTVENGTTNAHPVNVYGDAPALTSTIDPPLFGTTYAFQQDGNVLALRIMPEIAASWESVTDRFKIVDRTASLSTGLTNSSFSELRLIYPERTVSVGFSSLTGSSAATLNYEGNATTWGTTCSSNELAETGMVVDLFGISLNGITRQPPTISLIEPTDPSRTLQEQKREVMWYWPDGTVWQAVVDPLAENALDVLKVGTQPGFVTFSNRSAVPNDATGSTVLTNGNPVVAGNVYGGGTDPDLNGVTFHQLNFAVPVTENNVTLSLYDLGGTGGYTFTNATAFYTASDDMAELMRKNYLGAYYANGIGISLSNLTVGTTYQLQGFYWDKAAGSIQYIRDANNITNRSTTFPTGEEAQGYSWTATWLSDSTEKRLEVCPGKSSRALLAGLSLRAISDHSYTTWLARYPGLGSSTNLTDNPDGDTLNNLCEWGLGGNPVDPADNGRFPRFGKTETGLLEYIHAKRNNAAAIGLTYRLEQTTNLISGIWTNGNIEISGIGTLDSEFDIVTNRIPTVEPRQFLRLIIEKN